MLRPTLCVFTEYVLSCRGPVFRGWGVSLTLMGGPAAGGHTTTLHASVAHPGGVAVWS